MKRDPKIAELTDEQILAAVEFANLHVQRRVWDEAASKAADKLEQPDTPREEWEKARADMRKYNALVCGSSHYGDTHAALNRYIAATAGEQPPAVTDSSDTAGSP